MDINTGTRNIHMISTPDKATLDVSHLNGPKVKVYTDLTHAQAHEIADFIKANVPEPVKAPGAREFITALEPGTRFRHQPSKLGYIRLTDGKVWSESAKAPFPIADFGDVYPGADYFEVIQ